MLLQMPCISDWALYVAQPEDIRQVSRSTISAVKAKELKSSSSNPVLKLLQVLLPLLVILAAIFVPKYLL